MTPRQTILSPAFWAQKSCFKMSIFPLLPSSPFWLSTTPIPNNSPIGTLPVHPACFSSTLHPSFFYLHLPPGESPYATANPVVRTVPLLSKHIYIYIYIYRERERRVFVYELIFSLHYQRETHKMQETNYHRNNYHSTNGGNKRAGARLPKQPIIVYEGQTMFRFLCHNSTIGGVIGHGGVIIKQLERETSAKISVQEPVRDCVERVILVVGSEVVNRTITVRGGKEGDEKVWDVSAAQEGLVRVFERAMEVEGKENNEDGSETSSSGGNGGAENCSCRLLARRNQIGAVMGKGGKNIVRIKRETGAKIIVLQPPACASSGEELIHITGGLLAVTKALITISSCLQSCPQLDNSSMVVSRPIQTAPDAAFIDPHSEFFPHLSSLLPPSQENSFNNASDDQSTYFENIPSLDAEVAREKVVIRLLCSTKIAGGVIGKGGAIVRTLQNETGASIKVAAPIAGSDDRVITISALENPETLHSPVQIAVVRVFARSVEVGIEKGVVPGLREGVTITARLLIASNQAGCLNGDGDSVVSEMREVTGADIQISGGEHLPSCGLENDELVQIIGEYRNVQTALLHVTGRVRYNCFPTKLLTEARHRSYPLSAIPDINPYRSGQEIANPSLHQPLGHFPNPNQKRIARGMNHLRLSNKSDVPSPWSPSPQALGRGRAPDNGLRTYRVGLARGSGSRSNIVPNTTVEIVVPENALSSVHGEDGGNLNRIRQISGAGVVMRNPSASKSEGIVVISGTPDQIRAAQSLLQAFIQKGK